MIYNADKIIEKNLIIIILVNLILTQKFNFNKKI